MLSKRRLAALLAVLVGAATLALPAGAAQDGDVAAAGSSAYDWPTWQKDLKGSRYASTEWKINQGTVRRLSLKWAFQLPRLTTRHRAGPRHRRDPQPVHRWRPQTCRRRAEDRCVPRLRRGDRRHRLAAPAGCGPPQRR